MLWVLYLKGEDTMEAKFLMNKQTRDIDLVKESSDHVELINGKIVIEDKTTVNHNNVVLELCSAIKSYIKANRGTCRVFSENVALYCNDQNFLLPDVMIVCTPDIIREDGIHGIPDFIAEVTSESTKIRDFNEKLMLYRDIGIREYWVVDLQRQFINVYLKDNGFIPEPFIKPDAMKINVFGVFVDTSSFWA